MKEGLYLAFVYIGLVIGAGFASGREIMEYFNLPSSTEYKGIILATFLFVFICYIILSKAHRFNLTNQRDYLSALTGRMAGTVKIFILLYLFCGFFTMLSGSGALVAQTYMLPDIIGIFLMSGISFLVLSFDIKGIVVANIFLVPLIIAGIIYIGIEGILFGAEPTALFKEMTKGTIMSAICYVCYNTISAPSVLIPLSKNISRKGIAVASAVGGFVLGFLIFIIWLAQGVNLDALWSSEIPMLKIASMTGRASKYIYTGVLFMSICTTAISQGFGILEAFYITTKKGRIYGAMTLCLIAIPFAMIKFSVLVAELYSFFGFMGLLWIGWLIYDYFFRS